MPVVTWGLIAFNCLVFVYELALPEGTLPRFFHLYGMVPARFSSPGWSAEAGYPQSLALPFVTSMFLHGGLFHLLSNMWTLWIFGDNVEDRMGRLRYLIFYLACGLAAGLVHWLTNLDSTVPTIGASGAIAGVLGAYLVLFPRSRVVTLVPLFFWPLFFEIPALFYLGFWFVSQLLSGASALACGCRRRRRHRLVGPRRRLPGRSRSASAVPRAPVPDTQASAAQPPAADAPA